MKKKEEKVERIRFDLFGGAKNKRKTLTNFNFEFFLFLYFSIFFKIIAKKKKGESFFSLSSSSNGKAEGTNFRLFLLLVHFQKRFIFKNCFPFRSKKKKRKRKTTMIIIASCIKRGNET